jgi:DNA-directed RNA polymerase specialized sigma24 family protein
VAETAAMLDASEAAVKLRIHEARRDLERRARKDPWFAELLAERGGGR